jgi:rhomboid family GlyGly-CTERM serine protease
VAALRLEPGLLQSGEYWRLLSGHFTHYSWAHWLRNILSLILLQQILGAHISCRLLPVMVVVMALWISAAILLFTPLSFYTGLSGVLHGLFTWGSLAALARGKSIGAIILAIVVLKLVVEQIYGPSPEIAASIGIAVAVEAHLYGAVAGLLCWLAFYPFNDGAGETSRP